MWGFRFGGVYGVEVCFGGFEIFGIFVVILVFFNEVSKWFFKFVEVEVCVRVVFY